MSDKPLSCWICCCVSECDNQVNIVNEEQVCDECLRELAIIQGEHGGKDE